MNNEIWRDIKGYEGIYQVSNLGNIKSLERKVPHVNHGKMKTMLVKEKIMKFSITKGYYTVKLCKDNKYSCKRVNRLVAETFIENKENKLEVNHKDGNKLNNRVDNLEWCTRSENELHAYKTGLKGKK